MFSQNTFPKLLSGIFLLKNGRILSKNYWIRVKGMCGYAGQKAYPPNINIEFTKYHFGQV